MYIEELLQNDYSSFPYVQTLFDENPDKGKDVSELVKLLSELKVEMSIRFSDFRKKLRPISFV